ncbi:MAG: amidohydrolase family protein [Planctomyces sp.]|jgi:predicted TIM-barrel fold metal-dependent hydrolase
MVIIDSHCHAGTGDGLTGAWDTRAPLLDYEQQCRRSKIRFSVLFACFHSDYLVANRSVAALVRRQPDRYFGYAFVHPLRDKSRMQELVGEAVEDHGFVGIKLHQYDGQISREVCEMARKYSLPVLYDVMGRIWAVDVVANEYPDINFIIPHLGSFADDWRAQEDFLFRLASFPNVHTDTSGVRRLDLLQKAVRMAGANKILFGTDGPFLDAEYELMKLRLLRLSGEEFGQMVSGNWLRLTAVARSRRASLAGRSAGIAAATQPPVLR